MPSHLHGQPVLYAVICYGGQPTDGERILHPLRAFGPPEADLVGLKPYTQVQTLLDAANPRGRLNYWKAEYFTG